MKYLLFLLTISISGIAHADNFEWRNLKHDNSSILSAKQDIVRRYGEGVKNKPLYECGFHSGEAYYRLNYSNFIYIGSDSEKFILEKFYFNNSEKSQLTYKGSVLSNKTSKEKFAEIFGEYAEKYFADKPDSNSIVLNANSDDAAIFEFEDNLLITYRYWSPC